MHEAGEEDPQMLAGCQMFQGHGHRHEQQQQADNLHGSSGFHVKQNSEIAPRRRGGHRVNRFD